MDILVSLLVQYWDESISWLYRADMWTCVSLEIPFVENYLPNWRKYVDKYLKVKAVQSATQGGKSE